MVEAQIGNRLSFVSGYEAYLFVCGQGYIRLLLSTHTVHRNKRNKRMKMHPKDLNENIKQILSVE